jgi:beta-1,2-mannobiose phosphorylase / 1,2-beta-oligomannan phosphorylase
MLTSTIPAALHSDVEPWHMGPWQKLPDPILSPPASGFYSRNIYNMATVRRGEEIVMIFRGEDEAEPPTQVTGRLGLAHSRDGIRFECEPQPVLVPQEWYESRGVEDPRLIEVDGTYVLTYTSYDGETARLCLATSTDLRSWTRHGLLFPDFPANKNWTKSGAILPQKINGRYPMYFGDSHMWIAWSSDLIHWEFEPEPVLSPREGFFDARLVEPGPPPMLTDEGILLIYNSADLDNRYAAGFALFDAQEPRRLLKRSARPFIEPTQEWEKVGYVPNVVFVESLEKVGNQWFLYYGGADRYVGLACCEA